MFQPVQNVKEREKMKSLNRNSRVEKYNNRYEKFNRGAQEQIWEDRTKNQRLENQSTEII